MSGNGMSTSELPDDGKHCWRCECLLTDDELDDGECRECYWAECYEDDDE